MPALVPDRAMMRGRKAGDPRADRQSLATYCFSVTEQERPKQHWIPAVVLGGFSSDLDRPKPRDRRLYVRHRHEKEPRVTSAKNLAYVRGLYDWDADGPFVDIDIDMLDDTFNPYERKLSDAFREVAASTSTGLIRFEPWIRALVPYVAGLTVRAPEFTDRISDGTSNALVQLSRFGEMTRSVASIMAADWVLLSTSGGERFIINDRGFAWAEDRENGRLGLLIPLMATHALVVQPNDERLIAGLNGAGCWMTELPSREMSADDVADANLTIARDALSWFAGAAASDVDSLEFGEPVVDRTPLGYSWPDRGPLGSHDQDWSAAMHCAGLAIGEEDWQPFGIFSSIGPGVRLGATPQGPVIQISFHRPQNQGVSASDPEAET